jgi:hypothetical protein
MRNIERLREHRIFHNHREYYLAEDCEIEFSTLASELIMVERENKELRKEVAKKKKKKKKK